ncbi:hypothetical protein MKJ04_09275 [Pontibacter sp. E15-1]|uniref:hypothetical protein n=1 Tax=Pontibacter sp. E15-1 TaxID=2919918 RepID=UPI001F4FD6DA|nr:hypothetical protein [Pontibacter sp. E15-1]MCJ8165033.1 hypothetical protein [Pontibacter sp. E15-1]
MIKILAIASLSIFAFSAQAQTTVPSAEAQVRGAVLAAPADKREAATVYGYTAKGELVELRKGTNELICLADDPAQKGFSVSCYHRDLEPFMARGRALRKSGKSSKEIFDMREQEVKSGKLTMPVQPSTLFVYTAQDEAVDQATGEAKDGYLRYVVYIPYATSESTGLPLKPEAPAMPWIMFPGTHGAHIMINPPMKKDTP